MHLNRQIGGSHISNAIQTPDFPGIPKSLLYNAWTHFLVTWDFENATGTITVNKVDDTVSVTAGGAVPVTWGESARFFGALAIYEDPEVDPAIIGPAYPLDDNYLVSLAYVWLSTQQIITDVDEFVTDEDTPVMLGPDGELSSSGNQPDFWFRGGPSAFVQNAGAAGEVELIGEAPIAQSISPKIGD
jgi:hypothetical protein